MQINHSNIEECLFNYFEGNLTEKEKVELMNFIHQNSEYERDFAAWAQSFTMQGEAVKDYRVEKLILIRKKPFFYHKATYLIFVVLVVACGYFFFKETPPNISAPKNEQSVSPQKNIVAPSTTPSLNIVTKKAATPIPSTISKRFEQDETNSIDTISASSPVVSKISLDTVNNNPVAEKELKINNSIEKDTASVTPLNKESKEPTIKSETTKEQVKKKKTKRPLNLTPSSKFLPVNDNF